VFEEGGDGRGGRRPRAREGSWAAEKSKGTRGRAARVRGKLVGRIKIHGPTRSHVNSRP
jgi:hypothetical protein